jgi:hypothetical protein
VPHNWNRRLKGEPDRLVERWLTVGCHEDRLWKIELVERLAGKREASCGGLKDGWCGIWSVPVLDSVQF